MSESDWLSLTAGSFQARSEALPGPGDKPAPSAAVVKDALCRPVAVAGMIARTGWKSKSDAGVKLIANHHCVIRASCVTLASVLKNTDWFSENRCARYARLSI